MTAGKPDWAKLHAMGKLPENQRHQIPELAALDKANEKIKELEVKNTTIQNIVEDKGTATNTEEVKIPPGITIGKCTVEGCAWMGTGTDGQKTSRLRMHGKKHK